MIKKKNYFLNNFTFFKNSKSSHFKSFKTHKIIPTTEKKETTNKKKAELELPFLRISKKIYIKKNIKINIYEKYIFLYSLFLYPLKKISIQRRIVVIASILNIILNNIIY